MAPSPGGGSFSVHDGQSLNLTARDLSCRRGERLVFSHLSLAVRSGECLTVTGRNGAGKSSLLAILAGRLRPETGSVALDGADDVPLAEIAHAVGHRDGLKSTLTAGENLAFAADILGSPRLSPREALEAVGLARAIDFPVAYLSAGQRRRTALARLLVAHRPVWLLDEPTSALDTASQQIVAGLIRDHMRGGGLAVAATHAPLGVEGAVLDLDAFGGRIAA